MVTLKKGSKGEDVKVLQRALGVKDDGVFGDITDKAVRAYQKAHGLYPDGIVGEKTWALLQKNNGSYSLKRSRRVITDIIVHCTASPEGKNLTVDDIRRIHKANGWSDIGYHFVVEIDGSIRNGRDVDLIGAHVAGHNAHSIGVVYVGGLTRDGKEAKDTRTQKQKDSLVKLLKELKKLYPTAKISGHRDFSPDLNGNGVVEQSEWVKACPCFDAKKEYRNI